MTFYVDTKTWVHGGNDVFSCTEQKMKGRSKLLNESGNMCCLGHIGLQLGVEKEAMQSIFTPFLLPDNSKNKYEEFFAPEMLKLMMKINDNREIDTHTRMKWLREIMKLNGHELYFV